MSAVADRTTIVLARELVAASRRGVRVLALTSMTSLVAGLAARHLGAELGLAAGFGVLDAEEPVPAITLGERALGTRAATRGPSSDTFAALARGRVGVAVTPAQLDVRGATNLAQVGGDRDTPGVALPGDRGLPENNDAPGSLWYVFPSHSSRQLRPRVDSVSGPPPSPGRYRRLLTPLGLFALDEGWHAVALAEGTDPDDVQVEGFPIEVPPDVDVLPGPDEQEARVLDDVDPLGLRRVEYLSGEPLSELLATATAREEQVA